MIYYKLIENNNVIKIGTCSKPSTIGTEITKDEYEALLEQIKAATQERQNHINNYITKIKNGTIAIDDVPVEFRDYVDTIINLAEQKPYTKEQYDAVLVSLIEEGVL